MTTLAELRQASLKEQKKNEQPAAEADLAPPEVSISDPKRSPVAETNGYHTSASSHLVDTAIPSPLDEVALRESAFVARIHESLSHKTLHPSGAKVSADMSPALFHRAKRYCLDHGNITMRQVLIDLLAAFLDEEGY